MNILSFFFCFFHSPSPFKIFVHSAFNCSVVVFFFNHQLFLSLWLRYFQWNFDIAHKFFCFDINLTSFYGCKTSSYCFLMSPLIFHSILAQSLSWVQSTQEKFIIFFSRAFPFDEFIALILFYSRAISLFLTHQINGDNNRCRWSWTNNKCEERRRKNTQPINRRLCRTI